MSRAIWYPSWAEPKIPACESSKLRLSIESWEPHINFYFLKKIRTHRWPEEKWGLKDQKNKIKTYKLWSTRARLKHNLLSLSRVWTPYHWGKLSSIYAQLELKGAELVGLSLILSQSLTRTQIKWTKTHFHLIILLY